MRFTASMILSPAILVLGMILFNSNISAQIPPSINPPEAKRSGLQRELIRLSKDKWAWMSEKKVDSLDSLFHEDAVFVHMGATMSKKQELDVIKSGRIHYKHVDIQEVSVRFVDQTAILLNRVRLIAVVGGNEVVNPFVVTEVYVQTGGRWKLASLSFTRLMGQ